ncbi:MAG: disulfide bond formation protein B [Candidatus Moraniibacteriota bacterium]
MHTLVLKILAALRNPRTLLLLIALYCAALLVFAMILVRVIGLTPCPLCIVQRFFYALVGLSALIGYMAWWPRLSVRVAGILVALFAFLGWLVAFRNVWLQRFPVANASDSGCAVSFGSLIDDVVLALGGTGNCATVDWTLIGLSIADWSLIVFTGLAVAGIWIYLKGKTSDSSVSSIEGVQL